MLKAHGCTKFVPIAESYYDLKLYILYVVV
jgi:hypothetical protein